LRANDIEQTIGSLKQVMKEGYPSEADLFVSRLVFEVLVRNYQTPLGQEQAKTVYARFKDEVDTPLISSIPLILESIELKDGVIFKHLIGVYQS